MESIVIGGPNGAGKSTVAARLIPSEVAFVNADDIALDLPMPASPRRDILAGRMFLERLEELTRQGADFALETTLFGRTLASRIGTWREMGYRFTLIYVWLDRPELSVLRVAERVRRGGHHIPEDAIHRRYAASLRNLRDIYLPISDRWLIYDNTQLNRPLRLAGGGPGSPLRVYNTDRWNQFMEVLNHVTR